MPRRCPQCGTEYPDEIAFCGQDGTITIQVPLPGDTPDSRLGARYGDYLVVARIADGAMGRVYEGRHVATRARVAIKVLHDEVARDRVAVERFKREYETAQSLESPWVVKVIDFGEVPESAGHAKSWFMTMEYLQGRELGAVLRDSGAMSIGRVLRVLCQAALGLDDAHSFGVIHRDLKPDNIFLCESPEGDVVRLLDFGSVKLQMETGPKLTAFGTTLGSPYYMSPEQAMGKQDVDQRTDVLALGAILYEMLTGKVAFEAPTVAQILMKIVNDMPVPASTCRTGLPVAIDDVIEKALAKDKKQRFGSTIELAAAVLGAFGLAVEPGRPGVERWASTPQPAIDAALAAATPAPARPYGTPASAPTPTAPAAVATAAPASTEGAVAGVSVAPKKGGSTAVLLAVAIGGLVLVGVCGVGALFYLLE